MTTFVLVPGVHTGGWVWEDVGAHLREAGAAGRPVTLTGAGDGGAVDLDTHIEDVVRLLDELGDPETVLVGHGYGVLPMLGAAVRRPERVARLVYVDTPPPGDGTTAAGLLPGVDVTERGDDRPLPPPAPAGWAHHGSTAGVPEEALARLSGRATAQPRATLTQPLRLGAAPLEIPTTGVLCTANGAGITSVQALVDMGDPRLGALAEPHVGFFELRTGHWPMLSAPGELADVLLRAARDEGHRLTPPGAGLPPHLRPFLLDVPERPRERTGPVDLYVPGVDAPRPAVLFVHGGPVPRGTRPTPRDWPALVGYGRCVAGLGAVGATVDHGLHDVTDYARAAEDVAAAVERVRADPRVDGGRVALWFFSGSGLLAADWLAAPPPWLRCVAATYPVFAPLPNWGVTGARFRPAEAVRGAGRLPVVLTRVERERPEIAATVEEFVTAAQRCGAGVETVDVPGGRHGFETTDHTDAARRAVRRAVRAVLGHLGLPC